MAEASWSRGPAQGPTASNGTKLSPCASSRAARVQSERHCDWVPPETKTQKNKGMVDKRVRFASALPAAASSASRAPWISFIISVSERVAQSPP